MSLCGRVDSVDVGGSLGYVVGVLPDLEVTGMQDASSHHGIGTGTTHSARIRVGWVLGIFGVISLVLLAIVAYDFATNVYIDGEALFGWVLIGFFASVAVFMGLSAAALIRSGRSGSDIDRAFAIGVALAVLGALVVPLIPGGDAWKVAVVIGGLGFVMMVYGVIRT